jgi:hypothetical protein
MDCHELSSPISNLSANATSELSSMAVLVGVSLPHLLLRFTPTRCVQRLRLAVELAAMLAMASLSRGCTALPPLRIERLSAFDAGGGEVGASRCFNLGGRPAFT